jgi:hypothetical protein
LNFIQAWTSHGISLDSIFVFFNIINNLLIMVDNEETPVVSEASLKKLKVTELRQKLAEQDLDTKGVKDDLVKRLLDHFSESKGVPGAEKGDAKPEMGKDVDVTKLTSSVPKSGKETSQAPISEAEKAKLRAERFGIQVEQSGSAKHIGGLGLFDPQEEYERRKKRAERFGLPVPVNEHEEKEKKKARAERFGLPVPVSKEELDAKKKERAERFMSEEEKKKLARAARFASQQQS